MSMVQNSKTFQEDSDLAEKIQATSATRKSTAVCSCRTTITSMKLILVSSVGSNPANNVAAAVIASGNFCQDLHWEAGHKGDCEANVCDKDALSRAASRL
jgi:hypothetical protein